MSLMMKIAQRLIDACSFPITLEGSLRILLFVNQQKESFVDIYHSKKIKIYVRGRAQVKYVY